MGVLREWMQRLRGTVRRGRRDEDLAEELRLHMELAAERGQRETGAAQVMEAMRDQRGLPWLDTLSRDVRYGLRVLGRSPVFTVMAIVSLALGIGANAAIVHLIDAVTLRTLPVPNPHELAEIRPDGPQAFGSYESLNARFTNPLWEQVRRNQEAFSGLFAWGNADFLVGRDADARRARGLWVSGEAFPVLGVTPEGGRLLTPADDRRGCDAGPAVISHGFWQTYFGADPSVVGRSLTVFDRTFTVAGVTPPAFTGLEVGQSFDVALPICVSELWGPSLDRRDRWWLTVMGRLKPGWPIARASEHLQALSPGLFEATEPTGYDPQLLDGYRKLRFYALPAAQGVSRVRDVFSASLVVLLGLTGLLLLITCGNLATLLLARASARRRELAVRAAIGASRWRLVSQMFVESLLVSAGGAIVALPVAVLSSRALVTFLDTPLNPVDLRLGADWHLVMYLAAMAVLTATVFGIIPAFRVSIVSPMASMTLASRGAIIDRHRAWFERGLVAAQVAVSLVLVVSALLLVQTFRNLATVDTGFQQDGRMVVAFWDFAAQDLEPERKHAFQQQLADAIRAVPGVVSAASTLHVPLSGGTFSHFFSVTGTTERKASRISYVDAGYFSTLGVPIRAGRAFTAQDTAGARRVAIVNEAFVRAHLDGRDPFGASIRTLEEPGYPETTYEIVGVAGDTKYADLRGENCWCDANEASMPPIAYLPLRQNPSPYAWSPVIVSVAAPLSAVTPAIAERITALNPRIAFSFTDMPSHVRQRLTAERLIAWLAGAFGVLAAVLVVVGIYGLIAYLATGRRNEIGVRLSLGSTRAQIVLLVMRDALLMVGAGVLVGLPLAWALTRQAAALLFGVPATDVLTLAGAALLLAAAASVAGGIPARRASRLDPVVVLRAE